MATVNPPKQEKPAQRAHSAQTTREPPAWRTPFLKALAGGKTITAAAIAAKTTRANAYEARQRDPEFMRAWDDAYEQGTDLLEAEADRRARVGWLEPVFYGGKQVGEVRRFDTTLLLELLRARRPEKYRQRTEVRHAGEGKPLTAGELEAIRTLGERPDLETLFEQLAEALADGVQAADKAPHQGGDRAPAAPA